MTKERIIEILLRPTHMTASDLVGLEAMIKKYPYFQAAHILSAYGSLLLEMPNYEAVLQKGILYASREDYFNEYISHRPEEDEEETLSAIVDTPPLQEVTETAEIKEEKKSTEKKALIPTRPKRKTLVENPDYQRKEANITLFREVEHSIRSLQSAKEKALDYLDRQKENRIDTSLLAVEDELIEEDKPVEKAAPLEESSATIVNEEPLVKPQEEQSLGQLDEYTEEEDNHTLTESEDVIKEDVVTTEEKDADLNVEEEIILDEVMESSEEVVAHLQEAISEEEQQVNTVDDTKEEQEDVEAIALNEIEESWQKPEGDIDLPTKKTLDVDEENLEAIIDKKAAFLKSIKERIEAKKKTALQEEEEKEEVISLSTESKNTNVLDEQSNDDKALVHETIVFDSEEQEDEHIPDLETHQDASSEESTSSHTIEEEADQSMSPSSIALNETLEGKELDDKQEEDLGGEDTDAEISTTPAIGFSFETTEIEDVSDTTSVQENNIPENTDAKQEEEVQEQEIIDPIENSPSIVEPPLEIEDYPLAEEGQEALNDEKDVGAVKEEEGGPHPSEDQKEGLDRDLMLSYIDNIKKKKVDTKPQKDNAKHTQSKGIASTGSSNQHEIIDEFIKKEKNLKPIRAVDDKTEIQDLSKSSVVQKGALVSENLAVINLKQGKKQKAIKIYEALILKNPSKKAYFASRIKNIKEEK